MIPPFVLHEKFTRIPLDKSEIRAIMINVLIVNLLTVGMPCRFSGLLK